MDILHPGSTWWSTSPLFTTSGSSCMHSSVLQRVVIGHYCWHQKSYNLVYVRCAFAVFKYPPTHLHTPTAPPPALRGCVHILSRMCGRVLDISCIEIKCMNLEKRKERITQHQIFHFQPSVFQVVGKSMMVETRHMHAFVKLKQVKPAVSAGCVEF